MPQWVHRTTKQLINSTATADLAEAPANYIREPDLSAITGFTSKYWEITGDTITLMDQAARDAVDAAEAAAQEAAEQVSEKARMDNEKLLKAMAQYFAQELNKIDGGTFTPLTAQIVSDGIKTLVDSV